jgi:histidinol phosphatase-like enzyme (inositol monophosphatase family)
MHDIDPAVRAELIATAHAMADAARVATLRHFRQPGLAATSKEAARFDPVTIADREAEEAMRAVLRDRRPEDGIFGEEYGRQDGSSGWTWVLDPIDGTRGYLSGAPTWGVLIAVGDDRGPHFGIIDQPFIGERFVGGFGLAETAGPLGQRTLATRRGTAMADAILYSTFPEVGTVEDARRFRQVADAVRLTRYGTDCYAYALLAAGHIDLVIEAGLQAYDVQAPMAVIEAAGGIVTDWSGGPAHHGGRVLAAGDAGLHRAALSLLNR